MEINRRILYQIYCGFIILALSYELFHLRGPRISLVNYIELTFTILLAFLNQAKIKDVFFIVLQVIFFTKFLLLRTYYLPEDFIRVLRPFVDVNVVLLNIDYIVIFFRMFCLSILILRRSVIISVIFALLTLYLAFSFHGNFSDFKFAYTLDVIG